MALDFPSNPVDGQTYSNFYYDSATGVWRSLGSVYAPNYLKNPTFTTATSATVPVTVQGVSSQSANLQEWKDSTGTTLLNVASDGSLFSSKQFYTSGKIVGTTQPNAGSDGGVAVKAPASGTQTSAYLQFVNNAYSAQWGAISADPNSVITINASQVRIPNQPSFLAYSNTGTASKAAGSWEDISMLKTSGGVGTVTTRYNIGNHFNTSTGRFTAPVAGQYVFFAGGWAAYNGAGNRYAVSFTTNNLGTNYISGANYSAGDSPLAMSPIVLNLAANDYVILQMFSAVATTLGTGSHFFYYGGYLLG